MVELLSLGSALAFGIGDFFGGRATRISTPIRVTAVAYVTSAMVLIPLVFLVPAGDVTAADVGWGALGGIAGLLGVLALYLGLARGPMGLVAPITAMLSALVPIVWGFVIGERPGGLATIGIVVGLIGVGVVSGSDGPTGRLDRALLLIGLAAGLGFGLFFIALDQTSSASGMWPLVGARAATVPLILLAAWREVDPPHLGEGVRFAIGAGVFDMLANGMFLAAAQRGLIAIAAVLAALYPAFTAILARTVLHERVSRLQLFGVALALLAIILIGLPQ